MGIGVVDDVGNEVGIADEIEVGAGVVGTD